MADSELTLRDRAVILATLRAVSRKVETFSHPVSVTPMAAYGYAANGPSYFLFTLARVFEEGRLDPLAVDVERELARAESEGP